MEQREKRRSEGSLQVGGLWVNLGMPTGVVGCSLVLLCCCVPSECLLVLQAGILGLLYWGKKVGGEDLCVPLGWGQRGKGDCRSFPAMELGMMLGIGTRVDLRRSSRCGSAFSLLVTLTGEALGLAESAHWCFGIGQTNK